LLVVATTLAVVAALHEGSAPLVLAALVAGAVALAAWRPLVAWWRARAVAAVAHLDGPALERRLLARDEAVRDAAAARLVSLEPGADLVARVVALAADASRARSVGAACALGRALPAEARDHAAVALVSRLVAAPGEALGSFGAALRAVDPAPARVAEALERETRPEARIALAAAIAGSEPGASALAAVLANADLSRELRGDALDALDAAAPAAVRPAVVAAFPKEGAPTPELLWALAACGEPRDLGLAAPHVAAADFPVASAACEAAGQLLERGLPEDARALAAVLARGRESLRAVHPPGDNRLADDLVLRLESLEAVLAEAVEPARSPS
jgi:hypothetical protein